MKAFWETLEISHRTTPTQLRHFIEAERIIDALIEKEEERPDYDQKEIEPLITAWHGYVIVIMKLTVPEEDDTGG